MGFFKKIFQKGETTETTPQMSEASKTEVSKGKIKADAITTVNLKEEMKSDAITTINLRKEKLNKICLEKKELQDLTSKVVVVLDYSGSMDQLYRDGVVQETLNRLLPLALRFDDDGEMELYLFSNHCKQLAPLNINNFSNYIADEKVLQKYSMGGTNYSPAINKIVDNQEGNIPTFVIFITDGDCFSSDKTPTEEAIRKASNKPIFWQFVGIGNSSFDFLESLDDMQGRYIDNADFLKISNVCNLSDEELYKALLGEFPEWLNAAKLNNIIK